METKTLIKSIGIYAPKEKVWDVLLLDKFTRTWYAEFSEGSHAETDRKVGSKAVFTDTSGCGIFGKIIENKPAEMLSLEYEGEIVNGQEITDSPAALSVKGGHETYRLTANDQETNLTVEVDMGASYFDMMAEAWDRALLKIKELSVN